MTFYLLFRICIRSQSYDSFQMVPSSPSGGSDSGLTSDQETIGPVSSPYQTFKMEDDLGISVSSHPSSATFGLTTSKSWDAYESLDVLENLFKTENDENTSDLANLQVKTEPGELQAVTSTSASMGFEHSQFPSDHNQDFLINDIHELLCGSGSSTAASSDPLTSLDTHDDSSTDLFPDLGDVGCIDPLIASY